MGNQLNYRHCIGRNKKVHIRGRNTRSSEDTEAIRSWFGADGLTDGVRDGAVNLSSREGSSGYSGYRCGGPHLRAHPSGDAGHHGAVPWWWLAESSSTSTWHADLCL